MKCNNCKGHLKFANIPDSKFLAPTRRCTVDSLSTVQRLVGAKKGGDWLVQFIQCLECGPGGMPPQEIFENFLLEIAFDWKCI